MEATGTLKDTDLFLFPYARHPKNHSIRFQLHDIHCAQAKEIVIPDIIHRPIQSYWKKSSTIPNQANKHSADIGEAGGKQANRADQANVNTKQ